MRGIVWVEPARELWLFLTPRNRTERITLRHDGTSTLGHVVESLGIPLTEVGSFRVDGTAATADHRPDPGVTIEVDAVERPQSLPPRFVLDVHLGKLARRLRLLGVDTTYRNDASDDELIIQSAREERVLLTQDRRLLQRRSVWAGAYVRGRQPSEQLADVIDRFAPPLAPWTRCTTCNGELAPASKQDVLTEIYPGTRRNYDVYARCRACGRVFWRGAHARRINAMIRIARSIHPCGDG